METKKNKNYRPGVIMTTFNCLFIDTTFCPLKNQTQEIQLWGDHGEKFDEADVIQKLKKRIVVAIFSGFASGSFRGKYILQPL
jgi:hypothetical protein